MNPQQPPMQPLPPAPSPSGYPPNPQQNPSDPYQFIMEPPKPSRIKRGSVSGNPFLMKILFVLGGAVVVMMVLAIVVNIVFGSKTNVQDIVLITESQQEMIRISGQGMAASSQSIRNAAATTQLSLATHQQQWLNFLAARGRKVPSKELNLKRDKNTDTRLTQAQQTSTYDTTYTQVMRNQLTAYAASLEEAYNNASNQQEKTLLTKHYGETKLLLDMWPKSATP